MRRGAVAADPLKAVGAAGKRLLLSVFAASADRGHAQSSYGMFSNVTFTLTVFRYPWKNFLKQRCGCSPPRATALPRLAGSLLY